MHFEFHRWCAIILVLEYSDRIKSAGSTAKNATGKANWRTTTWVWRCATRLALIRRGLNICWTPVSHRWFWTGNCGRGSHLLLWTTRKICRLNYFMVENLAHLRAFQPRSNPWVGASMHAWKWAELEPPNSIYITPTVLNELIISPQVNTVCIVLCIFTFKILG